MRFIWSRTRESSHWPRSWWKYSVYIWEYFSTCLHQTFLSSIFTAPAVVSVTGNSSVFTPGGSLADDDTLLASGLACLSKEQQRWLQYSVCSVVLVCCCCAMCSVMLCCSEEVSDPRTVPAHPVCPLLSASWFIFSLYQGEGHPGPCSIAHRPQRSPYGELLHWDFRHVFV